LAREYIPLKQSLITASVRAITQSGVVQRYQELTGTGFPLNFSSSFINRGQRQVYWDIVSPTLKFQGLGSVASSR
jgi:hypothetical protein